MGRSAEEAARVFFVMNKMDYLSGLDRDEAIAFTQGVIADAVGRDVILYPMSARQALVAKLVGDDAELEASGLPAFERDLRSFLLREKGETILRSVATRAARLVDAERNSLDVQERALDLPQRELDQVRRRMEEAFARARTSQRDLRALLQGERDALVAAVEEDLAALRRDEEARLISVVERFLATREDVRDAGKLEELVRDTLRADVDRWRRDEEGRLGGSFRDATPASLPRPTGSIVRRSGSAGTSSGSGLRRSPFRSSCPRRAGSASTSSRCRRSSSRSCPTFGDSFHAARRGACSSGTCDGASPRGWISTAGACATTSSSGSTGVSESSWAR